MKVLFLSYEVAPIYKFGGLGDVAQALPKALQALGVDIRIGMPAYRGIKTPRFLPETYVPMIYAEDELFQKEGIIGVKKNPLHRCLAFAYFSKKILETVKQQNFQPDIIHLNDWHTSLTAFWLKHTQDPFFQKTKIVLTVHNTRHQGSFPLEYLLRHIKTQDIGQAIYVRGKKWVNFLRRGIICSDYITTVSENFAHELRNRKFGFGVDSYLREKGERFSGILNGIDYTFWNPAHDRRLAARFSAKDVKEGKARNKTDIQKQLRLPISVTTPLYVMIARLTQQKGFEILLSALNQFVRNQVQVVLLGEGDSAIVVRLKRLAKDLADRIVFIDHFDEDIARKLYAAGDFFLIPSVFEPCGLTQMIAMAYGTIPISSGVGGLADTIRDGVTGLVFSHPRYRELLRVLHKSYRLYHDEEERDQFRQRVMKERFSSQASAKKYYELYKKMIG